MATTDALTVHEHMVLQIEDVTWRRTAIGRKDSAIRSTLGISPVRHAQLVDALLERPAAEVAYPVLVHRLQRLRDGRRQQRLRATG